MRAQPRGRAAREEVEAPEFVRIRPLGNGGEGHALRPGAGHAEALHALFEGREPLGARRGGAQVEAVEGDAAVARGGGVEKAAVGREVQRAGAAVEGVGEHPGRAVGLGAAQAHERDLGLGKAPVGVVGGQEGDAAAVGRHFGGEDAAAGPAQKGAEAPGRHVERVEFGAAFEAFGEGERVRVGGDEQFAPAGQPRIARERARGAREAAGGGGLAHVLHKEERKAVDGVHIGLALEVQARHDAGRGSVGVAVEPGADLGERAVGVALHGRVFAQAVAGACGGPGGQGQVLPAGLGVGEGARVEQAPPVGRERGVACALRRARDRPRLAARREAHEEHLGLAVYRAHKRERIARGVPDGARRADCGPA